MPKGHTPTNGFKPGKSGNPNGRPKGARSKITMLTEKQRIELAQRTGITPLEFLMSVLRDPAAPFDYKVECAKIASPYLHRKMPIAIEGGDPTKPLITLDAAQLRNISTTELKALKDILAKIGAGVV